jgi:outer membrane lipoprotein-sorting protein
VCNNGGNDITFYHADSDTLSTINKDWQVSETRFHNYSRYKAILEEKYGEKVKELYLVCLHPDNKNKNYQRISVVDLQEEVKELFNLRKIQIAINA